MLFQWTTDLKFVKTDWNKPYLSTAPVLILVFKQSPAADARRKQTVPDLKPNKLLFVLEVKT